MNREALRQAWQFQNIVHRQYQEHEARCSIKAPGCAKCVELRSEAQGMYIALDQINPAHDRRYDSAKLFWSDDEEPDLWRGTNVQRD